MINFGLIGYKVCNQVINFGFPFLTKSFKRKKKNLCRDCIWLLSWNAVT